MKILYSKNPSHTHLHMLTPAQTSHTQKISEGEETRQEGRETVDELGCWTYFKLIYLFHESRNSLTKRFETESEWCWATGFSVALNGIVMTELCTVGVCTQRL